MRRLLSVSAVAVAAVLAPAPPDAQAVGDPAPPPGILVERQKLSCVLPNGTVYLQETANIIVVPFYSCPEPPTGRDRLEAVRYKNLAPSLRFEDATAETPPPVQETFERMTIRA